MRFNPDILWVRWVSGLAFALVLGHFVTKGFLRALEMQTKLPTRDDPRRVRPGLTGFVERLAFALIVAFDVPGAAPAMIGWIAAKMAANWNSKEAAADEGLENNSARDLLNRRFIALLAGLLSLTFAVVGGEIARGSILVGSLLGWVVVLLLVAVVAVWFIDRRVTKAALGAAKEIADASRSLVAFRFGMADTDSEDFLATTDHPQVIADARAQLALPEKQRRKHITGVIERATPGANLRWSWQHTPSAWRFAQVSTEVCDARPSYVEQHLNEWLESPGRFCPWACYIKVEEVGPPPSRLHAT